MTDRIDQRLMTVFTMLTACFFSMRVVRQHRGPGRRSLTACGVWGLGLIFCLAAIGCTSVPGKSPADSTGAHVVGAMGSAELYRSAFDLVDRAQLQEMVSLDSSDGSSEALGRLVVSHQNVLAILAQATQLPAPDWGFDLARDGDRVGNDIGKMFVLGQLVHFVIQHEASVVRMDRVHDAVVMKLRMIEHVAGSGNQEEIAGSMVALSMQNRLYHPLSRIIGRMTEQQRSELALLFEKDTTWESIDRMLDGERFVLHDWPLRVMDQDMQCLIGFHEAMYEASLEGGCGPMCGELVELLKADPQQFMVDTRLLGRYIEQFRTLAREASEDSLEAMKRLEKEIDESRSPVIDQAASLFAAVLSHRHAQSRRHMLRAAIAVFNEDEAAFKQILDPMGTGPFEIVPSDAGFRLMSRGIGPGGEPLQMEFLDPRRSGARVSLGH